ncbi:MAG: HAD hydrolase-like protein, partial [Acidaminococcaceae bacterium]
MLTLKYISGQLKGGQTLLLKGILFDLDGTLVNTTDLIIKTFEETLQNVLHKEATREEIIRYFG